MNSTIINEQVKKNEFWLQNKAFDLSIFAGTVLMAFSFIFVVDIGSKSNSFPFWAFIVLVIACDVSHVYGTLYRVYLDKHEMNRRPRLYIGSIIVVYFIAVLIYAISPSLFFSVIAYYAVYHFIKQNYGFVALYKAKLNEKSRLDFVLDKWTLWIGNLFPIIWWHFNLPRNFSWFIDGDFNFLVYILNVIWETAFSPVFGAFPTESIPDIITILFAVYICFAAIYFVRQVYLYFWKGYFNPGKNLVMVSVWITWYFGIIYFNNDIIWSAMIIMIHAIPYFALIWLYTKRKHEDPKAKQRGALIEFLSKPRNWLIFYLFLFALGLIEEYFWDLYVWKDYLFFGGGWTIDSARKWSYLLWVPLLSLPQLVHYYLDGHIWIFGKKNPDLKKYIFPEKG